MSKELTLRVPSALGDWVRSQPGSHSDVALALAESLYRSQRQISVADPGPGDDRLKLRLSPRLIRFVRKATRSKDTVSALRKLLLWGAHGCALPESRRALSPAPSVVRAPLAFSKPVAAPRTLAAPVSSQRLAEHWAGVTVASGMVPAYPSPAMPGRYDVGQVDSWFEESRPGLQAPGPALGSRAVIVLAIGLPVALLFGSVYALKALGGFAAGAKATAAAGAAVKAAPGIPTWVPGVARGLGVLFGA